LLRYLRIAFSGVCGIVCLLLIALWVRSYSFHDCLEKKTSSQLFQLRSERGRLAFWHHNPSYSQIFGVGDQSIILQESSQGRTFTSNPITNFNSFLDGKGVLGIGRVDQDMSTIVFAPYWFFLLFTLTLTAIPWLPWRFSLRTLLIAMTLIAVVLGVIVAM
jgi:hypothetical protein